MNHFSFIGPRPGRDPGAGSGHADAEGRRRRRAGRRPGGRGRRRRQGPDPDRPAVPGLRPHVLADAGYRRVCLVIGPEHDQVRDYYGRHLRPERLDVSFAVQEHPRETADAVAAAEGFDAGEPFLMVDSDNYYPLDAVRGLRLAGGSAVAAFERDAMIRGGNIPAGRVVKFAAVDVDPTGHLRRIIETPDAAALAALGPAVYLSMNCWRFTPAIFEACRRTRPSPRGELEITGAVQLAIDDLGERFRVLPFTWPVLDLSCRGDVGPVSQRLAGTEVVL